MRMIPGGIVGVGVFMGVGVLAGVWVGVGVGVLARVWVGVGVLVWMGVGVLAGVWVGAALVSSACAACVSSAASSTSCRSGALCPHATSVVAAMSAQTPAITLNMSPPPSSDETHLIAPLLSG